MTSAPAGELPERHLIPLALYPAPDATRDRQMVAAIESMLAEHAPDLLRFYREIWTAFPQKRLLLQSAISVAGVYCNITTVGEGEGIVPYVREPSSQRPLFPRR